MTRQTAAWSAVLLALAVLYFPQAGAHSDQPNLERLSFDPVPGDYTLLLRVENFELVPHNATGGDTPGEGQVEYLINGFPCEGRCSIGQAARTDVPHFTYHGLQIGDNLTARLLTNTGKPVLAGNLTGNATLQPVTLSVVVIAPSKYCVQYATDAQGNATTTCAKYGGIGPFLAVASGVPNAGDYTLRLRVDRFTLVGPAAADATAGGEAEEAVDTGHVVYTKNGAPCTGSCSGDLPAESAETVFTFHGVAVGDRLGAELVRPDGSSLAPRTQAVVVVARPSVSFISSVPQEGSYTMRVNVTGFTLAAPGSPANAGTGHILYSVKPKDGKAFEPAPCGGKAQTASTSFTFCSLNEGDTLTAELVDTQGKPLSPRATAGTLDVHAKPSEGIVSPGVGPLFGVLVVALAATRRSKA